MRSTLTNARRLRNDAVHVGGCFMTVQFNIGQALSARVKHNQLQSFCRVLSHLGVQHALKQEATCHLIDI